MIKVGASSTTLEPDQAVSEQPKERIPLMAIPVTLAIGLLVAGVYVGNRVFASRAHATPIMVVKQATATESIAKPTAFGPLPGTQAQMHAAPLQPAAAPLRSASAVTAPAATIASAPAVAPPLVKAEPAAAAEAVTPRAQAESKPENLQPGSEVLAQDKDLGLIAPQHGERYLQIAAIASHMVPSFLADLKKYNVQASVAPGPHDGLVRVVIGPFADRDTIARAKEQIQTKWPDCFVRLY